MFTFKYEGSHTTVIVTTKNVFIHEIADDLRKFLLAVGFHPDDVKEVLGDAP